MGNIGSLSHEEIGGIRSDLIVDSPREKVQASAACVTRSRSAEVNQQKQGGKSLASHGAKCHEILQSPSLPHPKYVFENHTSVYDTDHEEKGEDNENRKPKEEEKGKKGSKSWPLVSALKFLAKPFKNNNKNNNKNPPTPPACDTSVCIQLSIDNNVSDFG